MRITIQSFALQGFNLSPEIVDVHLRIYALNSFIRQSNATIVQPGGPGQSPFYEEWRCTRDNGSLLLPQIDLESTIDALSPAHPESLRYFAGFFDPGGNMVCAMWPKAIFALDRYPNPTTWAHICAYNSPGVEFDWTTTHAEHYSKEEFDYLLQNPPSIVSTPVAVLPPLYFDGTALWIPRATAEQDGYLAAEDFIAFSIGAGMGVISFNTRQGVIVLLDTDVLAALGYTPLNRSGDTMTGPLILAGNPATGNPFEAATRGYVDSILGGGDVTPPAITNVHTSTPTTSSVTIMWDTTGEASDSQVEYGNPGGASGSYPNATSPINPSPGVTTHSVPLTSLTAGVYHYRVKSRDFATPQNTGVSGDNTFTIPSGGGGDTTPPSLSAETAVVTGTSVTITWTTNELANSEVNYGLTTGYGTLTGITQTGGVTTGHSVTITGLAAGTYHYQCKSRDLATTPNLGVSSADHTFTITGADGTAPVITAVNASGITTTDATITWTTDDFSDSQVQYSVDPDTSYSTHTTTTDTGAGVQSHLVTLSGVLAPGTTYHYRVKSTNAAALSQTGVATPDTFVTDAPLDLLTNLISYWKMDETGTSTPRLDSAPAAHHNDAAPTVVTDVAGVQGRAAHVPGTGDRLIVANSASMQTGPVDFTWAVWVKFDTVASKQQLVYKGLVSAEEILLYYYYPVTPVDRFLFSVVSASSTYTTTAANTFGVPVAGQWYFVVAWHNATTNEIGISINDGPDDIVTSVPPLILTTGDVCFGEHNNTFNAPLNGALDEMAFWKGRVLPAAERTWLYNGGSGRPFSSWT